ncbi:barstar family protein [Tenacibaculum xiamenense]|uniref:barstar family protein n=1 Tax=Tenacibaculum xiamenense TaxID=1261553 RepID=UPI003896025E
MKIGIGFDKYPESYDFIATFNDISGIEGENVIQYSQDNNPINLCEITLYQCDLEKEKFIDRFNIESELYDNSAYLYILSSKGEILTSTYISDVKIEKIFQDNFDNLNVIIRGWLIESSKGFYEITKKRLTSGIKKLGEWKSLPAEKVQGWLDSSLRLGIYGNDKSNKYAIIDGKNLDSQDKFYCALGEEINGIGGYFGRNLDALHDCFYGGFGITGKFTLEWLNHEVYKLKFPEYFKEILEVFSVNNKTIILK